MKSIFLGKAEKGDIYAEEMRALMLEEEEDDWEYDSMLEEAG